MSSATVKVSVIIPCHNHGEFIREAMQSVLASVFKNYEMIVVNDGSTDTFTLEVFKDLDREFPDHPKVRIVHQAHSGVAAARNNGIGLSRGKYILPLDADDRIAPHYLNKAAEILENNPDVGVVYPHAQFFGEKEGAWEFPPFDPKRLLLYNSVVVSSVYRREIWEACNGYDPEMRLGYEDWEFWISAMEKGWKFHLLSGPMFEYRMRSGSRNSACDIPENRRALIRYLCNKHKKIYAENLEYVISEKDVELSQAHIHIRTLEAAISDREADLSNIYDSRGWKALLICCRIRDRIIPLNSKRRRLAKHIFNTMIRLGDILKTLTRRVFTSRGE